MQLALSQRTLDEGTSPSFCAGRKLGEVEQALLWTLLREDPQCPSRVLLDKVAERQILITVSLRHVNRWRAQWQLNGRKGRPRQPKAVRLLPLQQRSSGSRPICRVWVCICLPIGSTNRMPLARWWLSSRRQ